MNSRLLHKLVFASMKNNKKTLFPFFLSTSITILVYYILASLAFGPFIYYDHKEVFYGAQTIAILLEMGSNVVGLFAMIFIFYANQFVMKERKREIGLYGVLGLSRFNIGRMMIAESALTGIGCLLVGIAAGSFLNKIMLLLLYKIVGQGYVEGLFFSWLACRRTLILFGFAFAICCIYNIFSVNVGSPIELLRSNITGEKEPKVKWIMLIVGIVCLASGYSIALGCKSPSQAINSLFGAIFLVIIGTYFLFITGSIFILKTLKKNKNFYYQTRNFVSVSNLIYRMKHNAAGLASICVLSTAVILLITCATSLMTLGRKNINTMFPSDVMMIGTKTINDKEEDYIQSIREASDACEVNIKALWSDTVIYDMFQNTENGFSVIPDNAGVDTDGQSMMYILTAEEYERLSGQHLMLEQNQIWYVDTNKAHYDTIQILGNNYEVVGKPDIKSCQKITQTEMTLFNNAYIVLADDDARAKLYEGQRDVYQEVSIVIGFDLEDKLEEEKINEYKNMLMQRLGFEQISFKAENEKFFVSIYGGVFFVGLFLAVLFLMATVLIIYYKQMSEGFEDKKRYEILKKVGLTDKEVRITIKRQVMILFFLPVLTAILHMVVASKIVRLFLYVILVVDSFTFNMSILAVALIFLVIYALVYKITSNEYYHIVN